MSQSGRPSRYPVFAVGILLGLVAVGVARLFIAPSILTRRVDLPFERKLAELAKQRAIPASANNLQPPGPLDDRRTLARGREAYNGSCAICHGADGDGRGRLGTATYPTAADLRAPETRSKSDGQLFWITKHGLSFVGMPAFGEQYPDEAIWAIVGYVRALANGTAPTGLLAPEPAAEDLAFADPHASEAARRGAAIFFERGCFLCHGPRGDAVGNMRLSQTKRGLRSAEDFARTLAQPPLGMPTFHPTQLDDREMADLLAYIQWFMAGG